MNDYDIIDRLFMEREEETISNIEDDVLVLKNKVKGAKKGEINAIIADFPKENSELKEKLLNYIDNLVVDYNIMLAYYNKKYYKQGFEDALEIKRKCE